MVIDDSPLRADQMNRAMQGMNVNLVCGWTHTQNIDPTIVFFAFFPGAKWGGVRDYMNSADARFNRQSVDLHARPLPMSIRIHFIKSS